jgi:hypothetical protein
MFKLLSFMRIEMKAITIKQPIRYRISVSRSFPATHPRNGEKTYFIPKLEYGIGLIEDCKTSNCVFTGLVCIGCFFNLSKEEIFKKIHTLRANYELWQKRFEKINRGEAILELYYWSGKPYNSKTVVICQLGKDDGIGLQKFQVREFVDEINDIERAYYAIDDRPKFDLPTSKIAKNDGLSLEDFKAWFKGYDLTKSLAIIHFTKYRY